jgi:phytoene desaturase
MGSHHTALIIGAGLSGIATAARLARNGYKVTVLEKNLTPGGRCGQLIRDGHRFDTGPTLFLIPQVFRETYTALGERMEDHLNLHRIDPTYRFHFENGTKLDLTTDLKAMCAQLEAIEPGSFGAMLRYIVEGHQHFQLALQRFSGRNFYNLLEFFSPRNLSLVFKLKGLIKHYNNVSNYFQHPYLRSAFTFQDMYLGLSPYEAPATYSLLQYTELVDGVWYPKGGMYAIVESLISIAESHGVRFIYNAPVKKINVNGRNASGVILKDGSRFDADVIVANADLPYVYRHLIQDKTETNRLERKKYTCSAIMFYWGVDKIYPQLKIHNLFVADDYQASFDRVFKDYSLPDEPNFYVHAPTRTDPTAAPADHDTLMVLVPVSRLNDEVDQDWEALQSRARSVILDRLADFGAGDLEQHLKFEVSYTPVTYHNKYNLAKGAAFGSINHNFSQLGYLRPHNRHRHFRNLYFAGGSTHPGNGLPLVLLSARLTTERILKEVGVPQPRRLFTFVPERIQTE